MKRSLFLLGLSAAAAIVGTVAYLYQTDRDVRQKVDEAAMSVKDLYAVVSERVQNKKMTDQQAYEREVARNQAWADQQWEAIGI